MPKKSILFGGYEGKRLTPLATIRSFCRYCMGNSAQLVDECISSACPFHPYRTGTISPGASRRLLRVIKTHCSTQCLPAEDPAGCSAGKAYLSLPACPCWPYRKGISPFVSARVREKRRELGRKYGFRTAGDPVLRARIDETGPGDSPGHPCEEVAKNDAVFAPVPGVGSVHPEVEVEGLEIDHPLFNPATVGNPAQAGR